MASWGIRNQQEDPFPYAAAQQRGLRYPCGPTAILEPVAEFALLLVAFQGPHPLGTTTRVLTRTLRLPIPKKACQTPTPELCGLSLARSASAKTPLRRIAAQ